MSPLGQLLLVKTHKWRGSWGVPGGKIAYGEPLEEALLREFREETGLTLSDVRWGPIQEAIESPEFYQPAHFILLNFVARADSENVVLNDEAEAYAWVSVDEALRYNLNTPTRKLVTFYQKHGFETEAL